MASPSTTELLAAYDRDLRCAAELQGAERQTRIGPLWIGEFGGGQGFVSYRDLRDADADPTPSSVRALVAAAVAYFDSIPEVTEVEWKTRAHDVAPGLGEALTAAGFVADESESVMVGPAEGLVDGPVTPGVSYRAVTSADDVMAALRMQDAVFESSYADRMAVELLQRMASGDPVQLWVAEAEGRIVSAGRIDPVAGTAFAGVWGGATLPEYRGRGIYRALTAARVRAVLPLGVRFVHSDSTEDSRPILERSGLVKITETTPWVRSR